jgi:hypothetical protein
MRAKNKIESAVLTVARYRLTRAASKQSLLLSEELRATLRLLRGITIATPNR